jgi:hypothetical protein
MFRVVWLETALNELAAAWTSADSAQRQAIAAASHRIDQLLRSNPYNQGESRPQGQRIMFQPPLGLTFEVRPQTGEVRVLPVWIVRPRST